MPGRDQKGLVVSRLVRLAQDAQGKIADVPDDDIGKQRTRCVMPGHENKGFPSFVLDNGSGITGSWKCYVCGVGGSGRDLAKIVFKDVASEELRARMEALPPAPQQSFAKVAGHQPRARASRPMEPLDKASETEVFRALKLANEWFRMWKTGKVPEWMYGRYGSGSSEKIKDRTNYKAKEYDGPRDYLENRGVSKKTSDELGLGYAPPDTYRMLKRDLGRLKISEETLIQAGVFHISRSGKPHCLLAGRVTIPWRDEKGQIRGFGGRLTLEGAELEEAKRRKSPKYTGTSNTPVFRKSDTLYHVGEAMPALQRGERLWVVEGYMDTAGLRQAGREAVVSPIGVQINANQLHQLWRLHDTPVICFDADAAGRAAATRIAKLALDMKMRPSTANGVDLSGKSLEFVLLPSKEGPGGEKIKQDPWDVVKERGIGAIDKYFEKRVSLVEMATSDHVADTPHPYKQADIPSSASHSETESVAHSDSSIGSRPSSRTSVSDRSEAAHSRSRSPCR